MKALKRTRVGDFTLKDVGKVISIEEVLKNKQEYKLKEDELKKLINGVKIHTNLQEGFVRVYHNNEFIGVGEVNNKILKRKLITNFSQ